MTICLFSCLLPSLAHACRRLAPSRLQLPPGPPCHPRRRCFPLRFPDAHDTLTRNFPHIVWFLRRATAVAIPLNFAPMSQFFALLPPCRPGLVQGLSKAHRVLKSRTSCPLAINSLGRSHTTSCGLFVAALLCIQGQNCL